MDKDFILKANLLEHGIKISKSAKKILDSHSDLWLMDDYITCSGVTLHFNDFYATIGVEETSNYELIENDKKLYIKEPNNDITETTVITHQII